MDKDCGKLQFVLRAKCAGCYALHYDTKGRAFKCNLKMRITFDLFGNKPTSPVPLERCYRPKCLKDFKKAQELMERR